MITTFRCSIRPKDKFADAIHKIVAVSSAANRNGFDQLKIRFVVKFLTKQSKNSSISFLIIIILHFLFCIQNADKVNDKKKSRLKRLKHGGAAKSKGFMHSKARLSHFQLPSAKEQLLAVEGHCFLLRNLKKVFQTVPHDTLYVVIFPLFT